ncbi:MAG: hypothetical protein Q8T09_03260 [Candidatus Melainabacteria bacterium]|nr:hypothetical protein [Candidatus Melainabacteria bacterium]
MSFGRNLFIAAWLGLGLLVLAREADSAPRTWLPEASQFSHSRLLMEPGMQLPQGCGAINIDSQFFDALAQNAGHVAVYGALTTRQHQLLFDPEAKDLAEKLQKKVAETASANQDRLTILVLADPPAMGCELSIYAVSSGNSLREMQPTVLAAQSNEVTMTIVKVAQQARNSSLQQANQDRETSNNIKTGFVLLLLVAVGTVGTLIFLTELNSQRQIKEKNAKARAIFEKNKVAWQERIANLALRCSQFDEHLLYLDTRAPDAQRLRASLVLLDCFVEAGGRRIAEIAERAERQAVTKQDFELLTKELKGGFELPLEQPWYEGSPFEPQQKFVRLDLESYEKYATAVFAIASKSYQALNGIGNK